MHNGNDFIEFPKRLYNRQGQGRTVASAEAEELLGDDWQCDAEGNPLPFADDGDPDKPLDIAFIDAGRSGLDKVRGILTDGMDNGFSDVDVAGALEIIGLMLKDWDKLTEQAKDVISSIPVQVAPKPRGRPRKA